MVLEFAFEGTKQKCVLQKTEYSQKRVFQNHTPICLCGTQLVHILAPNRYVTKHSLATRHTPIDKRKPASAQFDQRLVRLIYGGRATNSLPLYPWISWFIMAAHRCAYLGASELHYWPHEVTLLDWFSCLLKNTMYQSNIDTSVCTYRINK